MVKLLAIIYLVLNGVQDPDPAKTYYYTQTFDTIAICEEARDSDIVKGGVEELRRVLQEQNPGVDFVIETKCVADEDDKD